MTFSVVQVVAKSYVRSKRQVKLRTMHAGTTNNGHATRNMHPRYFGKESIKDIPDTLIS